MQEEALPKVQKEEGLALHAASGRRSTLQRRLHDHRLRLRSPVDLCSPPKIKLPSLLASQFKPAPKVLSDPPGLARKVLDDQADLLQHEVDVVTACEQTTVVIKRNGGEPERMAAVRTADQLRASMEADNVDAPYLVKLAELRNHILVLLTKRPLTKEKGRWKKANLFQNVLKAVDIDKKFVHTSGMA